MQLSPEKRTYCPPNYVDSDDQSNGEWRLNGNFSTLEELPKCKANNSTVDAKLMRDNLANYFIKEGAVYWQNKQAYID